MRLWTEHARDEAPQWRGEVEHVQGGKRAYFRNLGQMLDLIVAYRGDGQNEREVDADERASAGDPEGTRNDSNSEKEV